MTERDYDRVANVALPFQRGFKVFGIDIEAGGGDDDTFFASAEFEIPLGTELAKIARTQPAPVFL